MRQDKCRGKLNNEGLTLVELLVAILILAFIVVPIFSNFVISARVNAKSRNTMNATNTAENIMEQFEAYTVEEMRDVMLAKGYNIQDTGALQMRMTGEESITGELSYDVEILLDGSGSYQATNDTEIADVQNLSGGTNAVFADSMDGEIFAMQYFEANTTWDAATLQAQVAKRIEIEIKKNRISVSLPTGDAAEVDTYQVISRCYYECDGSYLIDPTKNIYPLDKGEMLIFSNEAAVRERAASVGNVYNISRLDNVLLCVIPRYNSTVLYDSVTVKNEDNVDTNIYLVKQNMAGEDEMQYRLEYKLREFHTGWLAANGTSITSHAKLRTNVVSSYFLDAVEFENIQNLESISGADARTIMNAEGLTPGRASGRLYEITVNIYKKGTMGTTNPELVVTMSGTAGL